jgi:diaminopimelate epimerase
MEYKEISTQAEYDANVDFDGVFVIKSGSISVKGTSTVWACGNSTVEACGNSTVWAWDNSTVEDHR